MSNNSTPERALQALKDGDREIIYDSSTGEVVEQLRDRKFSWRARKRGTLRLADAFAAAHMERQAERARTCATWLEYLATNGGEDAVRQLHHYNACKQRLCPLCAARKAHTTAHRLTRILSRVQQEHPDSQLIFLTLTLRSVKGDSLRAALDDLTSAWYKLCHRRPVGRAVQGWYRAIEITRNAESGTYHPHIHAILAVRDNYFKRSDGLYITQERWREMWRQSLRCDYLPMVRIQRTKGKDGDNSAAAAALEAAKYAAKDSEYIGEEMALKEMSRVVKELSCALERKRLTAMGGWLKDVAKSLEIELDDASEDEDLVHGDDGGGDLTVSTAAMLEHYGWHFGVCNHILLDRTPNPAYEGGE